MAKSKKDSKKINNEEEVKDKETKTATKEKKETEKKAEGEIQTNGQEIAPEVEQKKITPEEEIAELKDKYLRLSAEFDNYKKRTLREKMDFFKSAGEDILINILPVMDDFERALKIIKGASDIKAIEEGVDLIYNKFKEFLKQRGVKEIESMKQDFNTDLHEAITKIPAPEENLKGKVVDVVEKGYYMNDKVIRYAKVVVGE